MIAARIGDHQRPFRAPSRRNLTERNLSERNFSGREKTTSVDISGLIETASSQPANHPKTRRPDIKPVRTILTRPPPPRWQAHPDR
jgi:hypothetical protein